jgi:hypothetical protein
MERSRFDMHKNEDEASEEDKEEEDEEEAASCLPRHQEIWVGLLLDFAGCSEKSASLEGRPTLSSP